MNRSIDDIREAQRKAANRLHFKYKKPIDLSYALDEPDGWPLTRPLTRIEWSHALKAMIMRRVPKIQPIHKVKLIHLVTEDLLAASRSGRIYVDADFVAMRRVYIVLDQMIGKDRTLRTADRMDDPGMRFRAPAVYRTEHAEGWLGRVPVTVQAVMDYLPTTNALDLLVQALVDDGTSPSPPEQSS